MGAIERYHLIDAFIGSRAVGAGFYVSEVADVTIGAVWAAVILLIRIEVSTSAFAVGHRAVAEFVNVETMLARLQAGQLSDDFDAVIGLRERDLAVHSVIAEAVHPGAR